MRKTIDIKSLTSRTLTRPRGTEAFQQLLPLLLSNAEIELSLTSKDPVSSSFLDEIVLRSSEKQVLKRIVFVIDSAELLRKLERIFSFRLECGRYRWVNENTVKNIDAISSEMESPSEEIKDRL